MTQINLPDPPACLAPVPVPVVTAGQDARVALAKHRAALAEANSNLRCGAAWYGEVRAGYRRK